MLIALDLEVLDSIVKDGIQDMMKNVAGRSAGARKRGWYMNVKDAIKDYQQKIQEDFLPVLVKDFSSKIVVKFKGGKMCDEDICKIKMFMEMLEKSNIKNILEALVKKIENMRVDGGNDVLKKKVEDIRRIVVDGHQWIFKRLELHIKKCVSDAMYQKTVDRSKIEVMLYNFVDGDVPASLKKMFENGMNSVPSLRLEKKEIDGRVEDALLQYLIRLGRRRICGHAVMQASNVQDWIRQVKVLNIDQDSRNFVESLENAYPALQAELDLEYKDINLDSKEEMVKKLRRKIVYW